MLLFFKAGGYIILQYVNLCSCTLYLPDLYLAFKGLAGSDLGGQRIHVLQGWLQNATVISNLIT